jgi:hypothetical protein
MFFAGFAFMFVFTYQYAIGLSKRGEQFVIVFYTLFLAWLYAPFGYNRGLEYLLRAEFLWIPIILYALAFVIGGAAYLIQEIVVKK